MKDLETGETLLTPAQVRAMLGIGVKTYRQHVRAGRLRYIKVGNGKIRPRRMHTHKNVETFIKNQKVKEEEEPCPSTENQTAHTGFTTSTSKVIGFTAARAQRTNVRRKTSRSA